MNVLLVQSNLKWNNATYNRAHILELLEHESRSVDLIILPEMFTTGFCTHPEDAAESEGETLEWMRKVAREMNIAITGSVATKCGNNYYNRLYFVRPDGTSESYDKHHLFTYGGEHKEYTAGTDRVVVEYMGWRILLQVCYDLRFPVFARNCDDYDFIIYVASWPESRSYTWNVLLRARAIENVSYVAGVNRVGSDPMCSYSGDTIMLDFMGKPLVEAAPGNEALLYASIDKDLLREFRGKFPALNDRDKFELK